MLELHRALWLLAGELSIALGQIAGDVTTEDRGEPLEDTPCKVLQRGGARHGPPRGHERAGCPPAIGRRRHQ